MTMPIINLLPDVQSKDQGSDNAVGHKAKCPTCQTVLHIQAPVSPAPVPAKDTPKPLPPTLPESASKSGPEAARSPGESRREPWLSTNQHGGMRVA